jgi:hypothetical protein
VAVFEHCCKRKSRSHDPKSRQGLTKCSKRKVCLVTPRMERRQMWGLIHPLPVYSR